MFPVLRNHIKRLRQCSYSLYNICFGAESDNAEWLYSKCNAWINWTNAEKTKFKSICFCCNQMKMSRDSIHFHYKKCIFFCSKLKSNFRRIICRENAIVGWLRPNDVFRLTATSSTTSLTTSSTTNLATSSATGSSRSLTTSTTKISTKRSSKRLTSFTTRLTSSTTTSTTTSTTRFQVWQKIRQQLRQKDWQVRPLFQKFGLKKWFGQTYLGMSQSMIHLKAPFWVWRRQVSFWEE